MNAGHEDQREPIGDRRESHVKAVIEIPREALRGIAGAAAVAVAGPAPDLLSQKNVAAITGIPPRVYLELIRSQGFPVAVTRLGKLRLVNRAAFVAYLESLASVPGLSPRPATPDDDNELVDRILAEAGLERKFPGGRARVAELPPPPTTRIRGMLRSK
ncbi:MAG: hypothetical protein HUU26_03405 [Gemmatimonadaceae bacterium]|nr:hypothetical protein [Gemmatimonadaceae bacterium]